MGTHLLCSLLLVRRAQFVFLEDTMTVRINYAMGRGDRRAVQQLFNAGIALGLASGLVAAVVATLLALNRASLEALVYPVYPGGPSQDCPLVETAVDVAAGVRPFFLLMAWQWPFSFVNRAISVGGARASTLQPPSHPRHHSCRAPAALLPCCCAATGR